MEKQSFRDSAMNCCVVLFFGIYFDGQEKSGKLDHDASNW